MSQFPGTASFNTESFNHSSYNDPTLPVSAAAMQEQGLNPACFSNPAPFQPLDMYNDYGLQGGLWSLANYPNLAPPEASCPPATLNPCSMAGDQSFFSSPPAETKQDLPNACISNGQPTPPYEPMMPFPSSGVTVPPCELDASHTATLPLGTILPLGTERGVNFPASNLPPLSLPSSNLPVANLSSEAQLPIQPNAGPSTPPRKRRRTTKPRKSATDPTQTGLSQTSASLTTNEGTVNEAEDEAQAAAAREHFLERNRLAATKCRNRKKVHIADLEKQFAFLEKQREDLIAEVGKSRCELLVMKNELLRHANCNNEPINLHLKAMVENICKQDQRATSHTSLNTPSSISPITSASSLGAIATAPVRISPSVIPPSKIKHNLNKHNLKKRKFAEANPDKDSSRGFGFDQ